MFANWEVIDKGVPLEEGAVIVIMLASVDAKKVVLQMKRISADISSKSQPSSPVQSR